VDEDWYQARARRESETLLVSAFENKALGRLDVEEFERQGCGHFLFFLRCPLLVRGASIVC